MDSAQNRFGEIEEIEDEIDIIFKNFKRFEVIFDPIDHWCINSTSLTKRKQRSIVKIQEEWMDLEQNLPASIYVRAYNGRIDLMRAALIGSRGTPYYNGLFFIDIQFPCNYPSDPPKLYFDCHGLELNPNLRCTGENCYWHGKTMEEKWDPKTSSILRVLISIQELILSWKPYYNWPGYEYKAFSSRYVEKSLEYNKQVFMLSFKAMLNTIRNPLKNFEYFVWGHFRRNSHKILMDCKEYLNGDENLDGSIFMELMDAFEKNGSYCKHFLGYTKELKERKLKSEIKMDCDHIQGTSCF